MFLTKKPQAHEMYPVLNRFDRLEATLQCRGAVSTLEGSVLDLSPDSTKTCSFCKDSRVVNAKNIRLQHSVPDDDQGGISDGMAIPCFAVDTLHPTRVWSDLLGLPATCPALSGFQPTTYLKIAPP